MPVRKKSQRRSPAPTAWSKRAAGRGWGRARGARGEPSDGAPPPAVEFDAAALDLTFGDRASPGAWGEKEGKGEGEGAAYVHACACVVA